MKSKKAKKYSVYALVDPASGRRFYVGCTTNPSRRRSQHKQEATWRDCAKNAIILQIQASGREFKFEVLDTVETPYSDIGHRIEQYWIDHLRNTGEPIVNEKRAGLNIYPSTQTEVEYIKSIAMLPVDEFTKALERWEFKCRAPGNVYEIDLRDFPDLEAWGKAYNAVSESA